MGYIVGGIEDFTEDHTQDPTFWKWLDMAVAGDGEPPLVENGHVVIPEAAVSDLNPTGLGILAGQFLLAGNHMAQRTTVKFSKTGDQYLGVSTRVHSAQGPSTGYQAISAWVDAYGHFAISSDGGTYVSGPEIALVDGDWYWLRCSIDDTHNVMAELFDSDPDSAEPIAAFTSDLPDDETVQYARIPGTGGFIASAGVIIDEFKFEYLEKTPERDIPDRFVPHEAAYRKLIRDELKTISNHAGIPRLDSTTNVEDIRVAVNQILDVLRDTGIIPSE